MHRIYATFIPKFSPFISLFFTFLPFLPVLPVSTFSIAFFLAIIIGVEIAKTNISFLTPFFEDIC